MQETSNFSPTGVLILDSSDKQFEPVTGRVESV